MVHMVRCFNRTTRCKIGFIALWVGTLCVDAISANSANYDTAWSFSYDGGVTLEDDIIDDYFRDVKILPNGDVLCVGETRDSTFLESILLVKLSEKGKLLQKKLFGFNHGAGGGSVLVAKNGDYVVGARLALSPLLLRLDTSLNIKSQAWYYDSIGDNRRLGKNAILQSLTETFDRRVIATGGDIFPDHNGLLLNNYAVWMEFDSLGAVRGVREWIDESGYLLSGWSLAETQSADFLVGGQQVVARFNPVGEITGRNRYTFSLAGVGTVTNNITRVRRLRDGRILAVGQAYEEDCWTRYQRLSFDGWWSMLSSSGQALGWNVAGVSGRNDFLYDATQLADGRIAFVGGKASIPDSGIWLFVTDTSGKTIEWQKQYNLPTLVPGNIRDNLLPHVLVATQDSGFLLVGVEGATGLNDNGFVFKFIPKPIPVSALSTPGRNMRVAVRQGRLVLVSAATPGVEMVLKLFDVQGVEVARYRQTGNQAGEGRFDIGERPLKRGVYLWKLEGEQALVTGSFVTVN
jgi:hypothetical protein